MEPAAVRETKFMIGSAGGNTKSYKRFLEENPIIMTDRKLIVGTPKTVSPKSYASTEDAFRTLL